MAQRDYEFEHTKKKALEIVENLPIGDKIVVQSFLEYLDKTITLQYETISEMQQVFKGIRKFGQ